MRIDIFEGEKAALFHFWRDVNMSLSTCTLRSHFQEALSSFFCQLHKSEGLWFIPILNKENTKAADRQGQNAVRRDGAWQWEADQERQVPPWRANKLSSKWLIFYLYKYKNKNMPRCQELSGLWALGVRSAGKEPNKCPRSLSLLECFGDTHLPSGLEPWSFSWLLCFLFPWV